MGKITLVDRLHNKPPTPIEMAREAYKALLGWLGEHPAIATRPEAAEAKLQLDRVTSTVKDLASAQNDEAKPLYDQWKAARAKYDPAIVNLEKLTNELKRRIKDFLDREEQARLAEAAEARREAEEAERRLNEAQAHLEDARERAAEGEYVDVAEAMVEADIAVTVAKQANNGAAVAERDADNVRLGGGFQRAVSVRTRMVPVVEDWALAIDAMGLTDKIRDAILSSARAFLKTNGCWPTGISEIEERSL